jgi:hypothetical protein
MIIKTSLFLKVVKIIVPALIIVFFSSYYLSKINQLSLHIDEHDWVRKSDFFDLFIERRFSDLAWVHFDAYDQPKLVNYLFGMIFHLWGWKDINKELIKINFNEGWRRPQPIYFLWTNNNWWIKYQDLSFKDLSNPVKVKAMPIMIIREWMVFVSLTTAVLFFLIGRKINNWLTGILAMILIGLNPLFFSYSLRAMAEGLLFFLMSLSLLLTSYFVKTWHKKDWQKTIILSVVIGLVNGLVAATKFTGFIAVGAFSLFCWLLMYTSHVEQAIKNLLISLLVALAIFILLDPTLWSSPPRKFAMMIASRISTIKAQQQDWPGLALTKPSLKLSKIFEKTVTSESGFSTFSFTKLPMDLVLIPTGLFLIIKKEKQKWKNGKMSYLSFFLIWSLSTFLILLLCLPLDWERYYLPLLLPVIIVEAYALDFLAKKVF